MFDTLKARFYLSSSSSQPVEALMTPRRYSTGAPHGKTMTPCRGAPAVWRHRGALAANLQLNRGGCAVHGSAASPLIYKVEI